MSRSTFRTRLARLSKGILSHDERGEPLDPDESKSRDQLLEDLRQRWLRERQATIQQAVGAIAQGERLYRVEQERARDLEKAHRELREAQAQLVQASKLASLGTLAAGVAHELNQPITVILGLGDLLLEHPGDRIEQHADKLGQIVEAGERLAAIVDNIRTFGRQDTLKLEPTNAAQPLDQAYQLISARLKLEEIRVISSRPAASELFVLGDPSRLQQVFLNLIVNARDALRASGSSNPCIEFAIEPAGARVRWSVSDNGPGVGSEYTERIFDPFFTTKPAGHGTGLGLSVSHAIIEEHGGTIRYERDGSWSRFHVEIARVRAHEAATS